MAEWEYIFDEASATKAENFFAQFLTHIEGRWSGQPFVLEPWQRDRIVRPLFGWKSKETGFRRYRKALIRVPRKNGKTTLAAGIALYKLLADREKRAQVYIVAENREQAGICYRIASRMVVQNSSLRRITEIADSRKRIWVPETDSFLQVLSGDEKSSRGINASCVIFEELLTQKDRRLFDALRHSQGARDQPLFIMLTTAGFDSESLEGQEYDYAKKVETGVFKDDAYLPVLYGADLKDDWQDREIWRKANPASEAMGDQFMVDLEDEAQRARNAPIFLGSFLRERLNIATKQEIVYIPLDIWDRNGQMLPAVEKLKGLPVYAGLDLAITNDLAALVLVFMPADGDPNDDGLYYAMARFWMPEKKIRELIAGTGVSWEVWADEGFIHVCQGDTIDFAQIEKEIIELHDQFGIQWLSHDPAMAPSLIQRLEAIGMVCPVLKQGWPLSPAMKELFRLLEDGRVPNGNNPVLRFNAANVHALEDTYGRVRPDKKSSPDKIDGFVALVMAIDGAMRNRTAPWVYAERGLISI